MKSTVSLFFLPVAAVVAIALGAAPSAIAQDAWGYSPNEGLDVPVADTSVHLSRSAADSLRDSTESDEDETYNAYNFYNGTPSPWFWHYRPQVVWSLGWGYGYGYGYGCGWNSYDPWFDGYCYAPMWYGPGWYSPWRYSGYYGGYWGGHGYYGGSGSLVRGNYGPRRFGSTRGSVSRSIGGVPGYSSGDGRTGAPARTPAGGTIQTISKVPAGTELGVTSSRAQVSQVQGVRVPDVRSTMAAPRTVSQNVVGRGQRSWSGDQGSSTVRSGRQGQNWAGSGGSRRSSQYGSSGSRGGQRSGGSWTPSGSSGHSSGSGRSSGSGHSSGSSGSSRSGGSGHSSGRGR